MSSQQGRSGNRVALLIGIVCAALAFGGVLLIVRQSQGGGAGGPTRAVVVAKADVDAGGTLTADSVRLAALPADGVPGDAFTDPGAVVGKVVIGKVSQNTPIVPALLAQAPGSAPPPGGQSSGNSASGTTTAIQPPLAVSRGHVALAIPAAAPSGADYTGDLVSVGYYIQAGDHIDILIDPGSGPPAVRYSFQDVVVLRSGTANAAAGAPPTVYIVELPRLQAEQLTFLLTHRGPESLVKYVVRPRDEYGKPGAPNYEDTGAAQVPQKQDQAVTADSLNRLFPH